MKLKEFQGAKRFGLKRRSDFRNGKVEGMERINRKKRIEIPQKAQDPSDQEVNKETNKEKLRPREAQVALARGNKVNSSEGKHRDLENEEA